MALNCRIVRAIDGSIDYIKSQEGTRSALFDSLVAIGNKQTAYDLYALTETEEFKEVYPGSTEASVEQVLKFASNQNLVLTEQDKIDIRNSAISTGFTSTGQFLNKLKTLLMPKGIVTFDRQAMERSGLYTSYEIDTIISSPEIQNSIKRVLKGMSSTESESIPDYDTTFVTKESKINSLGKQITRNPFIVEKQVLEIVAGTDIEDSIEKLPFDSIKNAFYNDSETKIKLTGMAVKNKVIQEKEIIEGQLIDKPLNKVYERLSEVMDFSNSIQIASKISFILNISPSVWRTSENSIYSLLKDLKKSSVQAGVDLFDIENSVYKKEDTEIQNFLSLYSDLLLNPNESNLRNFSDYYTEFFGLQGISTKVARTQDASDIILESELTEYELFVEQGLIKRSKNIYTPVEVIENIDEVYSVMAANTSLLPSTVTNEEELREYVQQEVSRMEIPDFRVDSEQLEKLVLYKMYFKSPIFSDYNSDTSQRFLQFKGDYNYYTQEFPSDFYKEYLREKNKNSEAYKNYYSNFTFTSNGIELLNNDPITIQTIMDYASDELKQYNMVSKNLNLPLETTVLNVDFNEMIYNREQAISNPNSIPKISKDYTILSPITIAVKNETETFVRTPVGVFEIDYQIGNVTFYNILPKSNSRYNTIGLYNSKTDSDLNLSEYGFLQDSPESFTRAKNYYSESELKKINQEHFGCS